MLSRELTNILKGKFLKDGRSIVQISRGYATNEQIGQMEDRHRRLRSWRKQLNIPDSSVRILDRGRYVDTSFVSWLSTPKDISLKGAHQWLKEKKVYYEKRNQEFIPDRHRILGCDLATAHFLLYRGGKVKFYGHEDWMQKNEDEDCKLPSSFDPNYVLSEIDASGMTLYYEGCENFKNLPRVKKAIFKGCNEFDDWCMDRITGNMLNLEYLDVSECEKVTERGLEAVYKLYKLKTLVVTNFHNSAAFEMTCLMLEEYLPDLTCKVLPPEPKKEKEEEEEKDKDIWGW